MKVYGYMILQTIPAIHVIDAGNNSLESQNLLNSVISMICTSQANSQWPKASNLNSTAPPATCNSVHPR